MSATTPALSASLIVETTVSSGLNARQATPETKHQTWRGRGWLDGSPDLIPGHQPAWRARANSAAHDPVGRAGRHRDAAADRCTPRACTPLSHPVRHAQLHCSALQNRARRGNRLGYTRPALPGWLLA